MSILLAAKYQSVCLRSLLTAAGTAAIILPLATTPAEAHVKWFAPYIVGAAPQPIMPTLTNT